MILLVQCVSQASVTILDGPDTGVREAVGAGLVALVGVEQSDADADARWAADKLARLRIFPDDDGKMNRSILDIARDETHAIPSPDGPPMGVLVVSQFTLAGDARKGARPAFTNAAPPDVAAPLVEAIASRLEREHRLFVARGRFGAMMDVALVNHGPVTIILRSPTAHA